MSFPEGVEVDENGRRVVRNKDGQIISQGKGDCDPSRFYCGTWSGIEVYTHTSTPVFMLAFIVVETAVWGGSGSKPIIVAYGIFYSLMLWVSIILHELCVAFTARRYGAEVDKILVWPLGGFGNTGLCKDPGSDIYVALAGPGSHVPLVLLMLVIVYEQKAVHNLVLSDHTIDESLSLYLALGLLAQQMLLLVVNLLVPLYPFDCGRIFMNLCTTRGVPIRKAVLASCIIGLFWFLAGVGFYLYQLFAHNGGYSRILFILVFGWMLYQIATKWYTRDEADCRKLKLTEPYRMWTRRMEDQVKSAPDAVVSSVGVDEPDVFAPPPTAAAAPMASPAPSAFADNPSWAQGESTTDDPEPLDLSNPFG